MRARFAVANTIRNNNVRKSEGDEFAVVLSGAMGSDVKVYDNNIDGEITRRGSANASTDGNDTNDGSMDNPIPVPAVTPSPGVGGGTGGGGAGGEVVDDDVPDPQPPLPSRDAVPKAPLPDISKRQAEANAAAGRLATARQALTQATATRLPSLSMDEIREKQRWERRL
jgi:hypothetical protein